MTHLQVVTQQLQVQETGHQQRVVLDKKKLQFSVGWTFELTLVLFRKADYNLFYFFQPAYWLILGRYKQYKQDKKNDQFWQLQKDEFLFLPCKYYTYHNEPGVHHLVVVWSICMQDQDKVHKQSISTWPSFHHLILCGSQASSLALSVCSSSLPSTVLPLKQPGNRIENTCSETTKEKVNYLCSETVRNKVECPCSDSIRN